MKKKTKYCKHPKTYDCVYCTFHSLGVKVKDLKKIAYSFYQEHKKSYSGHGCDRCGEPDEPYDLHDSMWNAVTDNTHERFLCLACVELRLGNTLSLKHFTDAPINYGVFNFDCRTYIENKIKKHPDECGYCFCQLNQEGNCSMGCSESWKTRRTHRRSSGPL